MTLFEKWCWKQENVKRDNEKEMVHEIVENIYHNGRSALPTAPSFPQMPKIEVKFKPSKKLIGSYLDTMDGLYYINDVMWSELNECYMFECTDTHNYEDHEMIKEDEVLAYYIKKDMDKLEEL